MKPDKYREFDVREVLSNHARTQSLIWEAMLQGGDRHAIVRVTIRTEEISAYEIDLLYNKSGNVNHAIQCETCGSWTVGEYCDTDACVEAARLEKAK